MVLGYAMVAVAAIWVLYKMFVSYNSAGGTDYPLAVFDAAIYPPLLATAGLFIVHWSAEDLWAYWIYGAVLIALVVVIAVLIKICEALGDKPLR